MTDRVLELCRLLDEATARHESFHNDHSDEPLEPDTPEFEENQQLLEDMCSLLDELAQASPETAKGAEAMAAAVLAHAGEVRPCIYRMIAQIHAFLCNAQSLPSDDETLA